MKDGAEEVTEAFKQHFTKVYRSKVPIDKQIAARVQPIESCISVNMKEASERRFKKRAGGDNFKTNGTFKIPRT